MMSNIPVRIFEEGLQLLTNTYSENLIKEVEVIFKNVKCLDFLQKNIYNFWRFLSDWMSKFRFPEQYAIKGFWSLIWSYYT